MSLAKGIEYLEKNGPLAYEAGFPIYTIERLIEIGMVNVSEPYRTYDMKINRWRTVRDVSLKTDLQTKLR